MADARSAADNVRDQLSGNQQNNAENQPKSELEYLRSIDSLLKSVIKNGRFASQSEFQDRERDFRDSRSVFGDRYQGWADNARKQSETKSKPKKGFLDSFEESLFDALGGANLKKQVQNSLSQFAKGLGVDIQDLQGELGSRLGKAVATGFRNSKLGGDIVNRFESATNSVFSHINSHLGRFASSLNTGDFQDNVRSFVDDLTVQSSSSARGSSAASDIHGGTGETEPTVNIIETSVSRIVDLLDSVIDGGHVAVLLEDTRANNSENGIESQRAPDLRTRGDIPSDAIPESAVPALVTGGQAALSGADTALLEAGPALAESTEAASTALTAFSGAAETGTAITTTSLGGLGQVAGSIGPMLGQLGPIAGEIGPAIAALGPIALAAGAALILVGLWANNAWEQLKVIGENIGKIFKALGTAANRDVESRRKNLELAQKRYLEDVQTLVRTPFEILEDAAKKAYDVWDQNLRLINATQGYTKSDFQELLASVADRLRKEGLADYIGSTDVANNLARVLESGLSGRIAEEFAYQATKLQAAVPDQDFFGFAASYASVASQAVRAGLSETEAIERATESLEEFTSGVLYARRELTGGFTTGLKDTAELYAQSVKIAQAAKSKNISSIAAVLSGVAGEVGALAPDLASPLIEAVYQAAMGGNSPELVALRSLAGGNASNTEFLRMLANDPQKVFASLFSNLAAMYTDSNDAFMEKAEAYASLFGLPMESFARLDFWSLAKSISRMQVGTTSLEQNLKLLKDGQTTTNAEQLRLAQVNNYLVEEGLALVLDNEAGRAIQQHMWDEQLAREMMEAEYGVNMVGETASAILEIKQAVANILNFFNPFAWLKKLDNIIQTNLEAAAWEGDIRQVLSLGAVGNGNAKSLWQLTTRNTDLHLTPNLATLMGGASLYGLMEQRKQIRDIFDSVLVAGPNNLVDTIRSGLVAGAATLGTRLYNNFVAEKSSYTWGSIGKSEGLLARAMMAPSSSNAYVNPIAAAAGAANVTANLAKAAIDKMLDPSFLDKYVKEKTYEEWAAASKDFGISNWASAVKEAGYTEATLKNYFTQKESEAGMQETAEMHEMEKKFYQLSISFLETAFPNDFRDPLFTRTDIMIEKLTVHLGKMDDIISRVDSVTLNQTDLHQFLKAEWMAADAKNNVDWSEWRKRGWSSFFDSSKSGSFNEFFTMFADRFAPTSLFDNLNILDFFNQIKAEEKESDTSNVAFSLAESIVKAITKPEDLKDPAIQTNVILSQILLVVQAIMQQGNNDSLGALLPNLTNSLTGASLGIVSQEV